MPSAPILLSSEALSAEVIRRDLTDPSAGALVIFEGRPRNQSEGQGVTELIYEAYPMMALKVMQQIRDEAIRKYNLIGCMIHHRTGPVLCGQPAVIVGCTSHHRAESFLATTWIMNQIKSQVPIWKQERFDDGSVAWATCNHSGHE